MLLQRYIEPYSMYLLLKLPQNIGDYKISDEFLEGLSLEVFNGISRGGFPAVVRDTALCLL